MPLSDGEKEQIIAEALESEEGRWASSKIEYPTFIEDDVFD